MLRDLERTPVLSQDGVVLSKKVQDDLRRMASKLGPSVSTIEDRWKRQLQDVFEDSLDSARERALASINPGAWMDLLEQGKTSEFFENVEYHARRLAKLDMPPAKVLVSVGEYEQALNYDLERAFPNDYALYGSALDHLYFGIKLTLNNAYYHVRDLEATAFYDVLQDQLETLRVNELLERVLETLTRTFRANAGVILLSEPDSDHLTVKAWRGLNESLARCFDTEMGEGFAGAVAATGKVGVSVAISEDPRVTSEKIRETFHSLWAVPLSVQGKVTGVMVLGFSHEYNCLPREMKLFEAVADRCALAIDKAQLVEELHEREEQIRLLGEHMMKVEEEERKRISRELHDEVGQSLLVVRLYLEMIEAMVGDDNQKVSDKLADTRKVVEDTIIEMRRLISALRPSVLEALGLPASIRQFVRNLDRTFPGQVDVHMSDLDELPEGPKIMMYRLVQECFTNAVKHSCADNVSLQVSRSNGSVCMQLQDDGVGFDVDEAARKRESFGLSGMRERVALLGGEIDIQTTPGEGTKVSIAIPVS